MVSMPVKYFSLQEYDESLQNSKHLLMVLLACGEKKQLAEISSQSDEPKSVHLHKKKMPFLCGQCITVRTTSHYLSILAFFQGSQVVQTKLRYITH